MWFEKSLETWDPRRGEDPGRGDSVRQMERVNRQRKAISCPHTGDNGFARTPPDKADARGAKCGMVLRVFLVWNQSPGLKLPERVNIGMNLTSL